MAADVLIAELAPRSSTAGGTTSVSTTVRILYAAPAVAAVTVVVVLRRAQPFPRTRFFTDIDRWIQAVRSPNIYATKESFKALRV